MPRVAVESSGDITRLPAANALMKVPASTSNLDAGTMIELLLTEMYRANATPKKIQSSGCAGKSRHGRCRAQGRHVSPRHATESCSAGRDIRLLKKKALPKGDVLGVACIAGIQAVKRTADLIPLCHPLPLHQIQIDFRIMARAIEITCRVETEAKTAWKWKR